MPFVNTLLKEEKPVFRDTLFDAQIDMARQPFVDTLAEDSVSENPYNLKQFTELTNYIRPFMRTGEVMAEEVVGGAKDIAAAFTEPPSGLELLAPTAAKTAKTVLGAGRVLFSPITAPIRAFAGEPAKQLAEESGASPRTAGLVQTGTELGLSLLAPFGLPKAVNMVLAGKDPYLLAKLNAPKAATPTSTEAFKKEVGDELTSRVVQQPSLSTAAKAKQFLETDLSKIEVPLPGVDRQVNYANYLITTEDAKKAIVASERLRGSTKITVPWAQTEKEAVESGITIRDLLDRGARQGHNTIQIEAFKGITNAAARNVTALRDKVNAGLATDAERALFMVQFDEWMNIERQFQGAKGEVARALNILGKPTGPAAQMKVLKGLADGKLSLANGKKIQELGVNELADLLKGLDNMDELSQFVKHASTATTAQKFVEAYKSALLTGLRTHEANLVTNLAIDPLHVGERAVAATLGKILPRGAGQDKVYFREIPAMISGMINGVREGARIAGRTLYKGPTAESAEKALDASRLAAIGGKKGEAVRIPFRVLAAEDDFFKEVARRGELNALATREAIGNAKTGKEIGARYGELISNPSEKMTEAADQFAKYSTFNKELGPPGKAFMSFVRTHPALQVLFPFIRTPTNIFKFAGERTPLAVFSPAVRAEFKAGGARRDLAIAKIMTGTAISTWAAWMAAEGRLTGRGPNDPEERRAWLATGKKPYSLSIDTDQGTKWLPLNRFEPFSTLLGPAADAVEIMKKSSDDEKTDISVLITKSFTANITNKTFLSSAIRAINATTDPERYGASFGEGLAGSLVPTISAEIAQSIDPTLRDPQNPLEAMQARIPGLSKDIKARRDIYGKPIQRHEGGTDPFNIFALNKETDDKAYSELERLKLKIQPPEKKIGGKEIPIDLFDRYEEESGRLAKSFVDKLVGHPQYDALPRLDKETLIKSFFNEARKITRLKLGIETKKQIQRIEKTRQGLTGR